MTIEGGREVMLEKLALILLNARRAESRLPPVSAFDGPEGRFDQKPECIRTVTAVLQALRDPDEGIIAAVVQQVGDPMPEQWALAERTCEALGVVSMNGERACAELARDWQAMIDHILSTGEG